MKRSE